MKTKTILFYSFCFYFSIFKVTFFFLFYFTFQVMKMEKKILGKMSFIPNFSLSFQNG